jgi:hypothetical protein
VWANVSEKQLEVHEGGNTYAVVTSRADGFGRM